MGRWQPEFTKYQAIAKSPSMKRKMSITESDFEYEHFPVVCPTCEGKGEICEDSHGLVTFVPVKDKRLKPAWTKLKVALLILVLVVTGALAMYFLYPRTVEFHVSAHNILKFDFQTSEPWLTYSFDVSIKNNNFFAVTVRDITMNLSFMKQSISKLNIGSIHVSVRGEVLKIITMNATYADELSKKYLRKQCYIERDYVGQLMQTSGELDYWVHSEHIESRDDYFYTDCGSLIFPLVVKTTLRPTIKTTTTTTTTATPTTTTPPTTTVNTTTSITTTKATTTNLTTPTNSTKSTTTSKGSTTPSTTTTTLSQSNQTTIQTNAPNATSTTVSSTSMSPKNVSKTQTTTRPTTKKPETTTTTVTTRRIPITGHVIKYDKDIIGSKD